jgi:hypothetical protein
MDQENVVYVHIGVLESLAKRNPVILESIDDAGYIIISEINQS